MSFYDDLWSGVALEQFGKLPLPAQDQVEACVTAICRDPQGTGFIDETANPSGRPAWTARAGSVLVVYQVDDIGESVLIVRIVDRG